MSPMIDCTRLALNPGVRLGPYEILSALGAGGMGAVYRVDSPDHAHGVLRDQRVRRDYRKTARYGLRDQHPIERIAVKRRKSRDLKR